MLTACVQALQHPVWTPYLGRRSCVPTQPLLPVLCDEYSSLEDALERFDWQERPIRTPVKKRRYEVEDAQGAWIRSDQPIDASHGRYAWRRVRYGSTKES